MLKVDDEAPAVDMASLRTMIDAASAGHGEFAPPGHPDRAARDNGPIGRIVSICNDTAETILAQAREAVVHAESYLQDATRFAEDVRTLGDLHARRLDEFGRRLKSAVDAVKEQQRLINEIDDLVALTPTAPDKHEAP